MPMFPRLCLSLIAPVSAAIWHWAEQRVPGHRDWTDVEVSPDGQTICAVTGAGDLISSYDGGETWYKWTDDFYRFNAVRMTPDASKIFTVGNEQWAGGYGASDTGVWIWTHYWQGSSNIIWDVNKKNTASGECEDVATTPDGVIIAAVSNNIWISRDGGSSWQQDISVGSTKAWRGIAMSSDGSKMVAVASGAKIWMSGDSGDIWEEATSSPSGDWRDVAISSDGSKIIAAGDSLFTSSDGGTTWVQASTVGTRRFFEWKGVAMSSDGSQMAACGYGEIWTSMDTGATWIREANFDTDAYLRGGGEDENSGMMTKISMSADGSQMVAVAASPGYIIIREPGTSTTITTMTNTTTASTRTTTISTFTTSTGTKTTATATSSTATVVTATKTTTGSTTTLLDEETSAGSAVSALSLVTLLFYPWVC